MGTLHTTLSSFATRRARPRRPNPRWAYHPILESASPLAAIRAARLRVPTADRAFTASYRSRPPSKTFQLSLPYRDAEAAAHTGDSR